MYIIHIHLFVYVCVKHMHAYKHLSMHIFSFLIFWNAFTKKRKNIFRSDVLSSFNTNLLLYFPLINFFISLEFIFISVFLTSLFYINNSCFLGLKKDRKFKKVAYSFHFYNSDFNIYVRKNYPFHCIKNKICLSVVQMKKKECFKNFFP